MNLTRRDIRFRLPPGAIAFIVGFDAGDPVSPVTFTVTVTR